ERLVVRAAFVGDHAADEVGVAAAAAPVALTGGLAASRGRQADSRQTGDQTHFVCTTHRASPSPLGSRAVQLSSAKHKPGTTGKVTFPVQHCGYGRPCVIESLGRRVHAE